MQNKKEKEMEYLKKYLTSNRINYLSILCQTYLDRFISRIISINLKI